MSLGTGARTVDMCVAFPLSFSVSNKICENDFFPETCTRDPYTCFALTGLTCLDIVEGLELQSFSYHLALVLVAGTISFLCLPCFPQTELHGGKVVRCFLGISLDELLALLRVSEPMQIRKFKRNSKVTLNTILIGVVGKSIMHH
eukprot:1161597-Pelagomonas_calceolata.AAC.1